MTWPTKKRLQHTATNAAAVLMIVGHNRCMLHRDMILHAHTCPVFVSHVTDTRTLVAFGLPHRHIGSIGYCVILSTEISANSRHSMNYRTSNLRA